jgi:hypothetical protein
MGKERTYIHTLPPALPFGGDRPNPSRMYTHVAAVATIQKHSNKVTRYGDRPCLGHRLKPRAIRSLGTTIAVLLLYSIVM